MRRFPMQKFVFLLLLILAACQPAAPESGDLPTLAALPTDAPTDVPTLPPTQTNTPAPTSTPAPSDTPTRRPTFTPIPPDTRVPTQPPPTATPNVAMTQTRAVENAPRFSTLTPAPGGNGGGPQVLADVVITERQFHDEVNRRIEGLDSIQSARVDFVPEGIQVQLTALGGAAFTTGEVLVAFDVANGFVQISIGDIRMNAVEPPEEYLAVVGGEFFTMMVDTLDSLLDARLGDEHNLESLVITDSAMEISLLVPQ